jgi:hypothetical protein
MPGVNHTFLENGSVFLGGESGRDNQIERVEEITVKKIDAAMD